jgi:hypothetical protein
MILGQTSKRYESGNSGPATISTGRGDYGGVSYGTYQFASRGGELSPAAKFVNQCSFADHFKGMMPGDPDFSYKWKEICAKYGDRFGKEQHDYIKLRYYDNALTKLSRIGIFEEKLCFGVKELIWSTAVQFGPSGCYNIFRRCGINEYTHNLSIIDLVYIEKSRVEAYFRSSSRNVQNNILRRYESERLSNIKDCV